MLIEMLLTAAVGLITYTFYKWATANNDYFKERNIKLMNPNFCLSWNVISNIRKQTAVDFGKQIYNEFPKES